MIAAMLLPAMASAQEAGQKVSFDVASVKPARPRSGSSFRGGPGSSDPGALATTILRSSDWCRSHTEWLPIRLRGQVGSMQRSTTLTPDSPMALPGSSSRRCSKSCQRPLPIGFSSDAKGFRGLRIGGCEWRFQVAWPRSEPQIAAKREPGDPAGRRWTLKVTRSSLRTARRSGP